MKKTFSIKGMNCNSCTTLIERDLKDKVNSVSASYAKETAEIDFDENKISENEIKERIKALGYEAIDKNQEKDIKGDYAEYKDFTQNKGKKSPDYEVDDSEEEESEDEESEKEAEEIDDEEIRILENKLAKKKEEIKKKRAKERKKSWENSDKEQEEEDLAEDNTEERDNAIQILEDKLNKLKNEKAESELKKEKREKIEEKEQEAEENEEETDEFIEEEKGSFADKIGIYVLIGSIILLLFVVYYFFFRNIQFSNISIPELGDKTSLLLLFAAGILTGFHCVSMCGGFVVSYTAKNALNGHKSFKQHLVYGGSKVISYTIIGGIFGLIGGVFAFSIGLRSWVAVLAGLFMIFYALSMFGIKFFRKFQFNPKFLTKVANSESNKYKGPYSRPLVTGLLNGLFIACGPLQAMYLYAMGTGSLFSGATSLFAFGLGTLPVMLGFGSLATVISHKTTNKILKISAVIVLILGLIMLNRGLTLMGSSYSFSTIKEKISGGQINPINVDAGTNEVKIENGIQIVNMDVGAGGYSPNSFVLKKGVPVKWNVNVKQLTGCNSELVMNDYNINARLKQGINTFEFTPDKTGTIRFSCGMGMIRGSFIVTETGTASQEEVKAAIPPAGMQCGGSGGGGCGCGG